MRLLHAFIAVALVAPASAPPKLASVPTALPEEYREPLLKRRKAVQDVIDNYNVGVRTFNARCRGVPSDDPRFAGCKKDMEDLAFAMPDLEKLIRSFNTEVDEALRRAHLVSSVTFTNVKIQGEVHFQGPDGKEVDAARIASLDIPIGTRIVTGPTGSFRADAPGLHSFVVGGGAKLTIDTVFVTPSSLQQLNVDLEHGYFRWLRKPADNGVRARADLRVRDTVRGRDPIRGRDSVRVRDTVLVPDSRLRDSSRYRVRIPTATLSIVGGDVEVDVTRDGSGVIRLHAGDVRVASRDSSKRVGLKPGEMIRIKSDGTMSDPAPLPPGTRPPPTEPTYSPRREP